MFGLPSPSPSFKWTAGPETQALTLTYLRAKANRKQTPPEPGARLCHQAQALMTHYRPSSCTWNLYPSLQMQHVRPGSSMSSSICFRSAVFVTTWPFSFVCRENPKWHVRRGLPPLPTLAGGHSGTGLAFHVH